MKMKPMTRFYLMRNMPETDQLSQCHMNRMSQLLNGLTTKHYWPVHFRINFFLVKVFLTDCQLNKIGHIFLSIMMVDLMILYLLLTASINCSMHVAFVTQLESLAKTWLLWKVLVCWLIQRNSKDNYSGQEIILTPKRQSPSMQRCLKFFQWLDPQFHTVLLNVQ